MVDDSPGKVQALRAIFSEKNTPLMGMLPPDGKIPNRPWKNAVSSTENIKEKKVNELRLGNKVLPTLDISSKEEGLKDINGYTSNIKNIIKPAVGPKPSHLLPKQQRTMSSIPTEQASSGYGTLQNHDISPHRTITDNNQTSKPKTFGETIASFMFTISNKENDNNLNDNIHSGPPPIPKPRTSQIQKCLQQQNHVEIMNLCNQSQNLNGFRLESQSCSIGSDNYICKSSYRMRRKDLPSKEMLGPAPLKPTKHPNMRYPFPNSTSVSSTSVVNSISQSHELPPSLPHKPIPQRPSYPCPPRPHTPPPLPPNVTPVITSTFRQELEELYEDTIQEGKKERPVSLIPEYTEEEEQAEELYNDAAQELEENSGYSDSTHKKGNSSPSEYLQPKYNTHGSNEELYQDADEPGTEEFYEVMPCDEIDNEPESPVYSNNKKEIEKLKREDEKRLRKEQKEKEKKEKEMEKLKKKFGLNGDEIPIDDGLVKCDSRGGKGDLPVKRGETVLILRMEGNPSGRWLVKNEKGKIGYVELTNIEVDPISVKSVMSIRRLSALCNGGEELYCEAKSEEAIYEVTY